MDSLKSKYTPRSPEDSLKQSKSFNLWLIFFKNHYSTANAFLHGVKNNYQGLGVSANVPRANCDFEDEDITYSIAKWAQDAGMATGIVTTTRITHAVSKF